MGTHGRRGWRRALIGSVAESVLRNSYRPVLIVPDAARPPLAPAVTRVVCPVNMTNLAREAVGVACRISQDFAADLVLVHIAEVEDQEPRLADRVREWVPEPARGRCSFRELTVLGDVAERVIDSVEDLQADLLVIGTSVRRIRDECVIGTTSERLLRMSPVPVLSVPLPVPVSEVPRPELAVAMS
jgi:nucleotide-binding universal stress UspA family protein